ncbi:septal ring lytic transglycosylase RlpA family protein [Aquabacter spiritensis]|uniref:Endolytic peptidoglycan transglycosylase RlpA n=1 Tax=Aquabacter spiritensis TaxID=933073 RepID=A0A4R3LQ11_9HYPH|nr:septal ring lytic transglycosylase RlpA family protein [Aquabacter spiritensis]TCT02624.1 rare lipoprotein A [Aquabacter spiritensis]
MTREPQNASEKPAWRGVLGVGIVCVVLAGCSGANKFSSTVDPKYGVSASPRVVADGEPIPKGTGAYRVGKPYVIAGRTYYPAENPNYKAIGIASWYGDEFHGRLTANGEVFDRTSISAAHPTLPMPSYVRVTNTKNNKSIIVRVNDRGPYHPNRIIDVSHRTADLLGFQAHGVARVKVEYVGRAPLEGSDDRKLMATLRDDGPAEAPSNSAVMVASATPFIPSLARPAVAAVSSDVPMPSQRPYDLGHELDQEVVQAAVSREQVRTVSAPVQHAFHPAEPAQPRSTVVASGWAVGPAPASGLGYAGVPAYGTGR